MKHAIDHRIIESFRLEETIKIIESINLTLSVPPLNHVPKLCIYTCSKYLQGWCLNHFPGQPVPMLYNSFSEEIFPNTQFKSPLVQHIQKKDRKTARFSRFVIYTPAQCGNIHAQNWMMLHIHIAIFELL